MSKKLLSQICFIFAAALCFAFEGGGLIQTEFGINLSSVPTKSEKSIFTSLKNSEKISLWAKQNMDKDGNYNFSIQSSYFFTFSQVMSPYKKRAAALNALDLDLLKFSFLYFTGKKFEPFIRFRPLQLYGFHPDCFRSKHRRPVSCL